MTEGAGPERREPEREEGRAREGEAPGPGEAVADVEPAGDGEPGWIRRLYDWVLHWADTPYGGPALFVLAFAESSFFPIPPDPLLMALALGKPRKAYRFAAWALLASVLGGLVGYGIGALAWEGMDAFFFAYVPGVSPESFERVRGLYEAYDFWAIFLAGLTPIPYKVFTISSGVFSINLGVFVVASILSRGLRFFAVAALIHHYGAPVKSFIDRYFNLLTWAFGILIVLGFVVIEFVL